MGSKVQLTGANDIMFCFTAENVYGSRTDMFGERSSAMHQTVENLINSGKYRLARCLLTVKRMGNANQRKGSILMEYLIVLVLIGAGLAVVSANNFYRYSDGGATAELRKDPPGFGSMGKKFVGFYQRTMGGVALPVP